MRPHIVRSLTGHSVSCVCDAVNIFRSLCQWLGALCVLRTLSSPRAVASEAPMHHGANMACLVSWGGKCGRHIFDGL